ncbi:alpha/beta-hydrolase [Aureobasidium subglaciale]|nr:alpha/beta-hydrolase [Aureobasidium subglaciale]
MIPASQINYLVARNFIVVIPNYRFCPQVTALEGAIPDTHAAYEFCRSSLGPFMLSSHAVHIDKSRIAAMALGNPAMKAITVLYPSLYLSKPEISGAHESHNLPPYDAIPDEDLTEDEWSQLCPAERQVSEADIPIPGDEMSVRGKYMIQLLNRGSWSTAISSNAADIPVVDPCTKFPDAGTDWPPTFFLQGADYVLPGSRPNLVNKAVEELKQAGVEEVGFEIVEGAGHLFDAVPGLGESDFGAHWEAVKRGLDFLVERV